MAYAKNSLAYCSNVHPGADVAAVINNIRQHFVAVKQRRNLSDMASGLWLSAVSARELSTDERLLQDFKDVLQQSGVRLTSLNGFPFGDFHQKIVKQNVYLPTWAQNERLEYTQLLATILADCLPVDENKGAISTLPLAYADGWTAQQDQVAVWQFIELSSFLADLEQKTGKQIVVCIEMEPDCVLQYTDELVSFFTEKLLPMAETQGVSHEQVLRYIGCCYDTCHQAVMGENITDSLKRITAAGIQIGKIQISNAVKANICSTEQVQQLTELFADVKFLHQTKVFDGQQLINTLADLNFDELEGIRKSTLENALNKKASVSATIHYHIPVNQQGSDLPLEFLEATQSAILSTLDFLAIHPAIRPFLEIETYTWLNFLSSEQDVKSRLHAGFEAEFNWLEQALNERGLLESSASTVNS